MDYSPETKISELSEEDRELIGYALLSASNAELPGSDDWYCLLDLRDLFI